MYRIFLLVLFALGRPAAAADLVVFAAASLTDVVGELSKIYQAAGHGAVVGSFASSSDLARQIEQGAPADLFISADQQWADYLDQRGLLDKKSRVDLLRNELVLVSSMGTDTRLTVADKFPLAAALGDGRLAVGDPDHVPAGIYAKAALQKLGVWGEIEPRLARAASVRAALLFVERGDCPFGIVYRTDALADSKVRLVATFPAGSHPPILYPAALVAGRHKSEGVEFLHFLQSPEAAAVFRRFGFERAE